VLDVHGITKAPVPVEVIARAEMITVAFEDLGRDDVSGMLYRKGGTSLIIVNDRHHHYRQRFTIAHEIGHADLHDSDTYLDGLASLRFRDERSATGTDTEEREANGFAAALLMPEQWVRRDFMRLVTGRQIIAEDSVVTRLAKEFDVSEQAMRLRLVNLNLIDPALQIESTPEIDKCRHANGAERPDPHT
jgi:Zn-dependent peptidase ImmA (M78 family)